MAGMTQPSKTQARWHRPPPHTEQVFDYFVSGFSWRVPSRMMINRHYEDLPSHLVWSIYPPLRWVHAGPGLLEDFLKLEHASDDAILAYASRWGPLWICDHHRLPSRHSDECETVNLSDWEYDPKEFDHIPLPTFRDEDDDDDREPLLDEDGNEVEAPHPLEGTWCEEAVYHWRALSRQFRATIRLARRLHSAQLGHQSDWDALPFLGDLLVDVLRPVPRNDPYYDERDYVGESELQAFARSHGLPGLFEEVEEDAVSDRPLSNDPEVMHAWWFARPRDRYEMLTEALGRERMTRSIEFQRQVLSEVLNYWLVGGQVRPRLDWSSDRPGVQLGGDGLFGALTVQLLFDCARTDGLAVCTSCGTPFLPAVRRPRRDHNPYCSDCGAKAAARDAAARYRQTEKYRATYGKWLGERRGSAGA
jgi:hypothetical protein